MPYNAWLLLYLRCGGVIGPVKRLLSGHFSTRGSPGNSPGAIDQYDPGFRWGFLNPQILGARTIVGAG